jgi:sugar (pentulose or hexulose) kinase
LADVFRLTKKVSVVKEDTALGASTRAGIGAKLEEVRSEVGTHFEASERNHRAYMKIYELRREVYVCLGLVEDGLVEPMWRAAGT